MTSKTRRVLFNSCISDYSDGDDAPWLARVAGNLADGLPSVTVLVNGGEAAQEDVAHSVAAGRPVVVVAGTGRLADILVAALRGEAVDERATELAASGLLRRIDPTQRPDALASIIRKILSPK